MGIITAVEPQRRDKTRVNIYVDGVFVCGLDSFTALKFRLKQGSETDAEKLAVIRLDSEKQTAFDRAAEYIGIRPRSVKEIADYLVGKGYLPETAADAVSKLSRYGYLDDERFAAVYVSSYKKRYGPKKLAYELRRLGVAGDIAARAVGGLDQREEIAALAEKYGRTHRDGDKRKLAAYLYGKGFGGAEISAALSMTEVDDV